MINLLRYTQYTLPNGRRVFLTNRPDNCIRESVDLFVDNNNPGIRFQFTDDWVNPPIGGPPWHWYPWVPLKDLTVECLFPFLTIMSKFDKNSRITSSVWMHCDSSSMRAPTYFGHYLEVAYSNDKVAICKGFVNSSKYDHVSDPLEYSKVSMERDSGVKDLVTKWKLEGAGAAYREYMKYDL